MAETLFTQPDHHKIVFLNGPPGCGKDTVVNLLSSWIELDHVKFSEPLKLQACALLGCTMQWLEAHKDEPHPALKGGTIREYLINMSEKFIKPIYGDDFFGHVAVNKIKTSCYSSMIVFTDSGFLSEAQPIVNEFGIENCVLIRLYREGHDFKNDSRSYWQMTGLRIYSFKNDNTIDDLGLRVGDYLSEIGYC